MHDFIHECVGFMCRCGFLFFMEYNDLKKNQLVGVFSYIYIYIGDFYINFFFIFVI